MKHFGIHWQKMTSIGFSADGSWPWYRRASNPNNVYLMDVSNATSYYIIEDENKGDYMEHTKK